MPDLCICLVCIGRCITLIQMQIDMKSASFKIKALSVSVVDDSWLVWMLFQCLGRFSSISQGRETETLIIYDSLAPRMMALPLACVRKQESAYSCDRSWAHGPLTVGSYLMKVTSVFFGDKASEFIDHLLSLHMLVGD